MTQQNPAAVVWRPCRSSKQHSGNDDPSSLSGGAPTPSLAHLAVFSLLLLLGTSLSFRSWITTPMIRGGGSGATASHDQKTYPPLTCPAAAALFCPSSPPQPPPAPAVAPPSQAAAGHCPAYFRWIHEDLRPWARTGITRNMVERAKLNANFRLVVLGGRAFVERYGRRRTFQTRDLFTQWGILQLLRRHPGRVPDLELMFDCSDLPAVKRSDHPGDGRENTTAPPLFRYGSDDASADIVFPDWSFWGWPEVNIKPPSSATPPDRGGRDPSILR